MNKKFKTLILIILLILALSFSGCGTGQVSVGVGVYVPGAWVGPYGGYGGHYPPVGIGYPVY
jgi:predicted small secreted protein